MLPRFSNSPRNTLQNNCHNYFEVFINLTNSIINLFGTHAVCLIQNHRNRTKLILEQGSGNLIFNDSQHYVTICYFVLQFTHLQNEGKRPSNI